MRDGSPIPPFLPPTRVIKLARTPSVCVSHGGRPREKMLAVRTARPAASQMNDVPWKRDQPGRVGWT